MTVVEMVLPGGAVPEAVEVVLLQLLAVVLLRLLVVVLLRLLVVVLL
jgi:hypothetical protein